MSEIINTAAEVAETAVEAVTETSTFFTEEAVEFLTAPMNPKTKILIIAGVGVLLIGSTALFIKRKDIKKKFEEHKAKKNKAEPVEVDITVETVSAESEGEDEEENK